MAAFQEVVMKTMSLDSLHIAGALLAVAATGAGACSSSMGKTNATVDNDGSAADGAPGRASKVAASGYLTAGPWMGYGFTATDPGAATIVPNCASPAGCDPAYTGADFCMHGTVTGRADYTGFAMLGWNLNQAATTGAAAGTWPVPDSGGVTVTVSNLPPSTALRVQLQGTNPHDSADRWCAALTSGQPLAWSDFKTNCWVGGTPQNPLAPGTMLQQGAILVPGLLTDLPFDVCLIDLQVQP
jgi:hypothetical protein